MSSPTCIVAMRAHRRARRRISRRIVFRAASGTSSSAALVIQTRSSRRCATCCAHSTPVIPLYRATTLETTVQRNARRRPPDYDIPQRLRAAGAGAGRGRCPRRTRGRRHAPAQGDRDPPRVRRAPSFRLRASCWPRRSPPRSRDRRSVSLAALLVSRAMSALVFGIGTSDPLSFAIVIGVLGDRGYCARPGCPPSLPRECRRSRRSEQTVIRGRERPKDLLSIRVILRSLRSRRSGAISSPARLPPRPSLRTRA